MALMHLLRLGAECETQHLVAEADAEHGQAGVDQLLDLRHGVGARGRGVAGAVGQEYAVRLALQDLLGAGLGGHHRDLAARRGEAAQDVALEPIIDGDDMQLGLLLPPVALAPSPAHLIPGVALPRRHLGNEVHADESRPGFGFGLELFEVELGRRLVRDHPVGHALVADARGQRARVDAAERDDPPRLEPLVELLHRPVVGGVGHIRAQHAAAHARAHGEIGGLGVLPVGADVADVGEGEGDDLAGVGGIGQDLLVAGHGGVEAHLAGGGAGGAQPVAGDDGAVRQHQPAGQRRLAPGFVCLVRHAELPAKSPTTSSSPRRRGSTPGAGGLRGRPPSCRRRVFDTTRA